MGKLKVKRSSLEKYRTREELTKERERERVLLWAELTGLRAELTGRLKDLVPTFNLVADTCGLR